MDAVRFSAVDVGSEILLAVDIDIKVLCCG